MATETSLGMPAQGVAEEIATLTARSVERNLPVFLLVTYRAEVEKVELLEDLRKELADRDLGSRTFDLQKDPEQGTGKLYARLQEAGEDVLSLVTAMPRRADGFRLDSDFLRYLNLHRDRIGRRRLRWVLFLHESDLDQLIREAGDLWAVRQHTWWLEGEPQRPESGIWISLPLVMPLAKLEDGREEIREHVQNVRRLVEEAQEPGARAGLLLDLSTWLYRRDASDQAVNVAFEALDLAPPDADRALQAALQKAAGEALARVGREDEALDYLERSRALFGQLDTSLAEAEVLETLGGLYRSKGLTDKALERLQEGLVTYEQVGPRDRVARVKMDLAMLRYERADYVAAIELLESAIELIQDTESPCSRLDVVALERLAHVLQAQGKPEQAEYPLTTALSYLEPDLGDDLSVQGEPEEERGKAALRNNLALIYGDLGRFDAACQAAEYSLATYRLLEDAGGEAIVSWNLAMFCEARGWLERAVDLARRAVDIESQIGHADLDRYRAYLIDLERRLERERVFSANRVAEPEPPKYGA